MNVTRNLGMIRTPRDFDREVFPEEENDTLFRIG